MITRSGLTIRNINFDYFDKLECNARWVQCNNHDNEGTFCHCQWSD